MNSMGHHSHAAFHLQEGRKAAAMNRGRIKRGAALALLFGVLTACIDTSGASALSNEGSITFRDLASGRAHDLGTVSSVRAQVVNNSFNVAVTLTSKVMLQFNGIPSDGDLRPGMYSGEQFRAVLMHTPWGEEALVGKGGANRITVTHHEQTKARITFSVIIEGLGRKIQATGSFDTERRFIPEQIGNNAR